MKTQLKFFLTIGFILTMICSFAQTKFENKKLSLLNDIYNMTTKGNINSFMKEKGFEKGNVEKVNEGALNEIYSFSSQLEEIDVHYSKDNKILGVYCIYDGAPNNVFIEIEIKDKGYMEKIVEKNFDGETVYKKVWKKIGSNLQFATLSDEKEKMGMVAMEIIKND